MRPSLLTHALRSQTYWAKGSGHIPITNETAADDWEDKRMDLYIGLASYLVVVDDEWNEKVSFEFDSSFCAGNTTVDLNIFNVFNIDFNQRRRLSVSHATVACCRAVSLPVFAHILASLLAPTLHAPYLRLRLPVSE